MKKITLSLIVLLSIVACNSSKKVSNVNFVPPTGYFLNSSDLENAVIYEANIRQYSPEGTFNAFTKDIPQLKELGVKIIWVMPIFPISQTKRKATGGDNSKFASEMPKEEQHKYLGSYYAVSNFKKVNPEFGTMEDFRNLVKTAHENGMYVILDWVPNHTGWDHVWIKEHPEFYTKNEKGEIIDPINPETGKSWGWTDVADLNYNNQELRKEMIADMQFWIKNENIDGFRCDVASNVPLDFWKQCIPQLRKQKNIFMLAEAWEPELAKEDLFDMVYAWEGHHTLNKIAQGKEAVNQLNAYMKKRNEQYETDDILMNFVDNHDENSWNGTMKSRLGDAEETMTALTYLLPGMPLIYSGDEYGLDYSLKFFEKDVIPKQKGKHWELRAKLGALKKNNPALNGGKNPASFKKIKTSNEDAVFAFEREKEGKKVLFISNLSKQPIEAKIELKGNFTEYKTGNNISFEADAPIRLKPWQYLILENK